MNVLVDTPVWSFALRRKPRAISDRENRLKGELEDLIREGRAQLLGPIRQEILSGIKEESQFNRIKDYLRGFSDPVLQTEDFEDAAQCNNMCRAQGIVGTPVDMLLSAVALRRDWALFSSDGDFKHYSRAIPLRLHNIRNR